MIIRRFPGQLTGFSQFLLRMANDFPGKYGIRLQIAKHCQM